MSTQSTSSPRRNGRRSRVRTGYSLPYYEQARTWYRYAKQLRGRPFDAYQKKELALDVSKQLRGHAFVLPARLEPVAGTDAGLRRLARWTGERLPRFVELRARIVQVDEADASADEVNLMIEEADATSSRNRTYAIGRLLPEDAFWVLPLLRQEARETCRTAALQFFLEGASCDGTSLANARVVIAGAHEVARCWMDWREESRARRASLQAEGW